MNVVMVGTLTFESDCPSAVLKIISLVASSVDSIYKLKELEPSYGSRKVNCFLSLSLLDFGVSLLRSD